MASLLQIPDNNMTSSSVLPPLVAAPLIMTQVDGDAANEINSSLSFCSSVRIHRPHDRVPQESDEGGPGTPASDKHTYSSLEFVSPACPKAGPEGAAQSVLQSLENTNGKLEGGGIVWTSPVDETTQDGLDESKILLLPHETGSHSKRPFRKWVQTLNLRRTERQRIDQPNPNDRAEAPLGNRAIGGSSYRRHSSSISSFAYVSATRDASISAFGTSIVPSSRKQAARSSKVLSKTDRSSRASQSARQSEDENTRLQAEASILGRSKQRRCVIEELIETEESYIGDVKFLMNAYMTILASSPSQNTGLRLSMYNSLADIVELHDQILGDLHRVVPDSEYTYKSAPNPLHGFSASQHHRPGHLDVVPEVKTEGKQASEHAELKADPITAMKVATVFTEKMSRFSIYEEYRAKVEIVTDDLKMAFRSMPNWDKHQRGLEALASCLSYARDWQDSKRAVSISDLFAKPTQRACRYPLLFQRLLDCTPVYDCPHAHSEIENALDQLHEVTNAMNKAVDDPFFKSSLAKTWVLQDRLKFPDQAGGGASKSQIRLFGRIHLCSVLQVSWQTTTSIESSYMICLLFRNWLCLAVTDVSGKSYVLQACLPLRNCSLDQNEASTGNGLQCHSLPFSWKVTFEWDWQLYEIIMTAHTRKEEAEWRRRLGSNGTRSAHIPDEPAFKFICLEIESIGSSLDRPGNGNCKPPMLRASAVPSKPQLFNVSLRNTSSENRRERSSRKPATVNRSKFLEAVSRVPVIALSRGDRARLEAAITDVWTRDVFLSSRLATRVKAERLIRPSAIRKINLASLTSTFGRRSFSRDTAVKLAAADEACTANLEPRTVPLYTNSYRLKLGLTNMRSKQDTYGRSNRHIDVSIDEKALYGLDSSDDKFDSMAYLPGGHTERSGYTLRKEASSSRSPADVPRYPVTQFIEDIGSDVAYDDLSISICKLANPTPSHFRESTSSGQGSSNFTEELLASSPAYEMMAPLTQQPCREALEKSARRWLKKPILHRGSIRRTFKKMQH